MAYETSLTLPVSIAALLSSSVSPQGGYDTAFYTDAVCTLGSRTGDLLVKVDINSSVNTGGVSLSAAANSVTISLSSAAEIPTTVVVPAYISESTFSTTTSSATVTIKSSQPNFLNTSISLSANPVTTVIDPTKSSIIDNLTNINDAGALVTTYGRARLVAFLG